MADQTRKTSTPTPKATPIVHSQLPVSTLTTAAAAPATNKGARIASELPDRERWHMGHLLSGPKCTCLLQYSQIMAGPVKAISGNCEHCPAEALNGQAQYRLTLPFQLVTGVNGRVAHALGASMGMVARGLTNSTQFWPLFTSACIANVPSNTAVSVSEKSADG
jgi:hypothetical protein